MSGAVVTGGCQCGAVRFKDLLSDRGIGVCHCKMCRRFASGPFLSTRFEGSVQLTEARGLTWYASSDFGKRGFCNVCGASLFWATPDAEEGDWAISAGALDGDPDQSIFEHIFVDSAAPYAEFGGDAPCRTEAEVMGT